LKVEESAKETKMKLAIQKQMLLTNQTLTEKNAHGIAHVLFKSDRQPQSFKHLSITLIYAGDSCPHLRPASGLT